jgi:hypothetical protein
MSLAVADGIRRLSRAFLSTDNEKLVNNPLTQTVAAEQRGIADQIEPSLGGEQSP